MKKLTFPVEDYSRDGNRWIYAGGLIGTFELLWAGIQKSQLGSKPGETLTKKEHKIIRGIKRKLKAISVPKDGDKDSRVLPIIDPTIVKHIVILEEAEYEMAMKLFDNNCWTPAVSEEVAEVYDLLDSAVTIDNSHLKLIADDTEYPKPTPGE